MPMYEVEYAITGYGTVTVYAANADEAWEEFSCNSKKDLLEGLPWEDPDLVQITEVESDEDEEEEDLE
jgi:hypothetical protein